MRSTLPKGTLIPIYECFISIPELSAEDIVMEILPDISDSKSASYPDETAMGRSMPFKSYQNSENRAISWTAHFMAQKKGDTEKMIKWLRIIEACTYPLSNSNGVPYAPPPICHLRCGDLLSKIGSAELCAVLKSYSVKFDTSVPWDETTFVPYKMDVDMQFEVVYNQSDLPGAERIMEDGVGGGL